MAHLAFRNAFPFEGNRNTKLRDASADTSESSETPSRLKGIETLV